MSSELGEPGAVVAAVTGDDENNLVVATLARSEFGVRRVIARINNPKNAWLFTPDMGVDVAIKNVPLPSGCTLAAVIRKGEVITPRGDTLLQPNDEVVAVIRTEQEADLHQLLTHH